MLRWVLILFYAVCLNFPLLASIEHSQTDVLFETDSKSNPEAVSLDIAAKKKETESALENSTQLHISPIYLTRDFFSISHFSRLPVNFQMTLNQILLSYELNNKNHLYVRTAELDTIHGSKGEMASVSFQHRFDRLPYRIETFCDSIYAQDGMNQLEAVSFGGRGKMPLSNQFAINSEIACGERKTMDSISPFYHTTLSGIWNPQTSGKPQVTLSYQYLSGDVPKMKEMDNDSSVSSISVMNVSLACAPVKSLFMSVDYYYYLQNEAEIQTLSNHRSLLASLDLNEAQDVLEEELNFKATYVYSKTLVSHLLAGWFNRGPLSYGHTDDSKTFEIRGEIIVNF
ncbi:MAG: hypothetical protein JW774_00835 [Candidatus Aureabacteria bacterium]|nr:hypothetical protein [Candidatus Auribacterota bacterium]